jgi:uncharacterized protein YkwD
MPRHRRKRKLNWRKVFIILLILLAVGIVLHIALIPDEQIEHEIFVEVNQARIENSLQPLERNAFMDELAREHCQYLRENGGIPASDIWGDIAHEGFMERAEKIIDTLGASDVAENVAEQPITAVNRWLDSPMHKGNILRPHWARTGIGVYGNYVCQIFSD